MFLKEKHTRIFFISILLLLILFMAASLINVQRQKSRIKSLMVNHDAAVASALLERGVPKNVIAHSMMNTEVSADGEIFLNQIGISEKTDTRMIPTLHSFCNGESAVVFLYSLSFSFLIILAVIFYLKKNEQIYKNAAKIIKKYTANDFSELLPELEDGLLFHLFSQINTMATALKAKAETENRVKDFLKNTVSDISHQLKTPLSALSMYNEIILDEPDNTEAVISFTNKSQSALTRIEQLIASLLKITRLDAGSIEFSLSLHPVSELISQSLEELGDRAKHENKKIILSGNDYDTIICDIEWTREAIGNIIKNALDHTKENDIITVHWEKTPMMFRLSVSDTGAGISDEDIHHIFKRFYRSKNSLNTQGIGLGLSLAKSIVEGQGGNISVRSEKNIGTTFTISFPA